MRIRNTARALERTQAHRAPFVSHCPERVEESAPEATIEPRSIEEEKAMNSVIWKCEQYVAGKLHEKTIFESEHQAREFARKLYDVRPDTILRIEPMPIQHVWN
jgi:hypothetical protein